MAESAHENCFVCIIPLCRQTDISGHSILTKDRLKEVDKYQHVMNCVQSILIRLVLLLILYDLDFLWDWQSVPHSRESAGDDGDDGMMMDDGKLAKCRNYLWNPWVVDVDVRNLRVFILPVIDFLILVKLLRLVVQCFWHP